MNALVLLMGAHLAVAVVSDVRSRLIPNAVVVSGLISALLFHAGTTQGAGVMAMLEGAATGLAAFMPLYLLRMMGAGDVKLMTMCSAYAAGWEAALWMVLYTFLAGGVLVVVYAVMRGAWKDMMANLFVMMQLGMGELDGMGRDQSRLQTAARLPYAVAIACGSSAYLLFGTN